METWHAVVGFEGLYEVSSEGRVRRIAAAQRTSIGRVLKNSRVPGKLYLRVCLRKDRENHHRVVHRLVLEAFRGARPHGKEARHLNGSAADNRLDNLVWGTPAENTADKERHGTTARGERQGSAILTEDDVRAIRAADGSYNHLAARFGVSRFTIRDIRKRWSWAHVT